MDSHCILNSVPEVSILKMETQMRRNLLVKMINGSGGWGVEVTVL